MAGAFPVFADGQSTRTGLVHSIEIRSQVHQFRSGAEQRYAVSGLLNSFALAYRDLRWSEVELLRDFFIVQKGAFDDGWTIDVKDPATNVVRTYEDMAFDGDEFSVTETRPTRYSVSLEAVQTVGEPVTVATQSAFPLLETGAKVQLPATADLRYRTFRNDLEAGKRISYYAWPELLRRWPLEFSLITDSELQTYVSFYLGQGGPVNAFTFADPDTGTVYENCRVAPGPVRITRVCRDCNKLSLAIDQYKS